MHDCHRCILVLRVSRRAHIHLRKRKNACLADFMRWSSVRTPRYWAVVFTDIRVRRPSALGKNTNGPCTSRCTTLFWILRQLVPPIVISKIVFSREIGNPSDSRVSRKWPNLWSAACSCLSDLNTSPQWKSSAKTDTESLIHCGPVNAASWSKKRFVKLDQSTGAARQPCRTPRPVRVSSKMDPCWVKFYVCICQLAKICTKRWLMGRVLRYEKSGCLETISNARDIPTKSCMPPQIENTSVPMARWWTLRRWFWTSIRAMAQWVATLRMASSAERCSIYANCGHTIRSGCISILNCFVISPSTFLPKGSSRAIGRRLPRQHGILLCFGRNATHAWRHCGGTKVRSGVHQRRSHW